MDKHAKLSVETLHRYPLPDLQKLEADYQAALGKLHRKVVVLDDDPTGVQTVHDVSVYTDWTQKTLMEGFAEDSRTFFVLTNSRAMPAEVTEREHRLIAQRIAQASRQTGKDYLLISRSDSTLRGHYPLEPQVLRETLESVGSKRFDGEIICPFFREGGRYTLGDVQYVREGDLLTPVGDTEFAADPTFGYHASHLADWVQEKSNGAIHREDCISIPLEELRSLNYQAVTQRLQQARNFSKIILNSIDDCDVKAFTVAFVNALLAGKEYLFRSAAAIPKMLTGLSDRPLLVRDDLMKPQETHGGLIVIGSYVQKSTCQLEALRKCRYPLTFLEFDVSSAPEANGLEREALRVSEAMEKEIAAGRTVAVYTSRQVILPPSDSPDQALAVSVAISRALTGIVSRLRVRPGFLIAKGGITSSDVGTHALGVRRATVMGQVKPGIPVWRTGSESRFPFLTYVIFPGNVGTEETLCQIVETLMQPVA